MPEGPEAWQTLLGPALPSGLHSLLQCPGPAFAPVLLGLTELTLNPSGTFSYLALWPLHTLSFASDSKTDKGGFCQATGSGISPTHSSRSNHMGPGA